MLIRDEDLNRIVSTVKTRRCGATICTDCIEGAIKEAYELGQLDGISHYIARQMSNGNLATEKSHG